MKGILIVEEMPERCKECPCMHAGKTNICKVSTFMTPKGNEFFEAIEDINEKPKWCPLIDEDKFAEVTYPKMMEVVMKGIKEQLLSEAEEAEGQA